MSVCEHDNSKTIRATGMKFGAYVRASDLFLDLSAPSAIVQSGAQNADDFTVTPVVTKFSAVARTLDRCGISDQAGSAIVSQWLYEWMAALQDVGTFSDSNASNVVDRNKIRRERTKVRSTVSFQSVIKDYDHDQFGLYFDGRKDRTLSTEDNGRKVIIEEHVSLVKEPVSEYIGHVPVNFRRAQIIGNHIYSFLSCVGNDIDEAKLVATEHPSAQVSKENFTGEIGKSLTGCEKLPVVSLTPIECTLCEVTNKKDFSTDQLYLMEVCEVINCGHCRESLSKRNPGKVCHSSLCAYVVQDPSIKPSVIYGAQHLHQSIVLSRCLSSDLKDVIDPVIKRKGFFGHPENVLISTTKITQALRRILKASKVKRSAATTTIATNNIRIFNLPAFDLCEMDYVYFIKWENMTEPPLTERFSDGMIAEAIVNPAIIQEVILRTIKGFPYHTQATEATSHSSHGSSFCSLRTI
ncbi:hypothetical protein AVEN_184247-1 [Araneus ventricosus]|uniref:Uncharacterized protein n=1 Tax=Araneus ventricosus TaxID=182803 RepID=A0A4Y2PDZ0_ARAVE|nr:hypothetical protein AVEN_184247-1 [Araneus ventricosus]